MTRPALTPFPTLLIAALALELGFATAGWAQSAADQIPQQGLQARAASATYPGVRGGASGLNQVAGKRQTKDDAASNIRPLDRVATRVENRVRNRLETRIGGLNDARATTTSAFEDADYRSRRARAKPVRR